MIEQQKVGFNRKKLGRPLLTKYHGQVADEICVYHLCGARGTYATVDRIIPLASDPEFAEILVNPITAPTFDRKMYSGSAESIDGSDGGTAMIAGDNFSASDTRKFKQAIELMPHPPEPVSMGGIDGGQGCDALYLGFVTPKMWSDYEAGSTDFQTMVSNASKRTQGFSHPLFKGEMFMKDNILFKKYNKPVGWLTGEDMMVCTDSDAATEAAQTVPAGFNVERGFILGGQALAMAYGSVLPGGMGNFKVDGELFNQKAWWRQWMDWLNGLAKIRFEDSSGRMNDYGVIAFDAAVSL